MAGTYNPTVTNYPNGVVSVISMDGTPYDEIQTSMGSVLYKIVEVYLVSSNASQVLQPLKVKEYSVNGNIRLLVDIPTIDPYQYQNSLFFKPIKEVVLNGNASISFDILGNSSINFIFYVKEIANAFFLKEPSLFQEYFYKQQYDFFGGFVDEI
jgi:hypothetical protein